MNRELASKLRTVGILVALAAIGWWFAFFGQVAQMTGEKPEVVFQNRYQCIVYTTTPCTIIYGVAQFAGYTPYSPILAWAGIGLFMLGVIFQ
jgi:hypothetical protein